MKNLKKALIIILIPVLTMAIFMLLAEGFSFHSLKIILNQTMLPTAMGVGVCAGFLCGYTDLSAGVKVVVGGVCGGLLAQKLGVPGLIIGCFAGSIGTTIIQALLYRTLHIPAMVLSVGIIMILRS